MTGRTNPTGLKRLGHVLAASLAVVLVEVAAVDGSRAATFTVDATADSADASSGDGICATAGGDCTLRAAVQEANALAGSDAIDLPAGTYVLTLLGIGEDLAATGDLDVTEALTLTGAGPASSTIDGNSTDRVFDVFAGVTLTISGVTVQNGDADGNHGGGIRNVATLIIDDAVITGNIDENEGGGIHTSGATSSLTITNSALSNNTTQAGQGKGGAIFVLEGAFSLTDVTLSGNYADEGGGLRNFDGTGTLTRVTIAGNTAGVGGGIMNRNTEATMDLTNVTVSGNSASDEGGGIQQQGNSMTLTNVTIAGNSATNPGGGFRNKSGTAQIRNTIIANSTSGGNCFGTMTSAGYNIDSANTCGLSGTGDQINTDPLLDPPQDNGGPTQTHALQAGSPAIDKGDTLNCPATDQRGIARPIDGDGSGTPVCDVGAYEFDEVPDIGILKSSQTISDPVNGSTNPKAIPGAAVLYTIITTNSGKGSTDNDSVFITDPIPVNTEFFVSDIDTVGSGPVLFEQGTTPSGLTYAFISLNSLVDDIDFSDDDGATWTYVPTPDPDGYDAGVTDLRVNPKGVFAGSDGSNHPSFSLKLKVRVD